MKTLRRSYTKKAYKKSFSRKAQSAMEYLMTYGWAILIIAVVLGALFSLGVFNSTSFAGSSCIAGSGFLCNHPILQGNKLELNLGQYTGTNWNSATFCIVPSGYPPPNSISCPSNLPQVSISPFNNGQRGTFTFSSTPSYQFPTFGKTFTGSVWVVYKISTYHLNITTKIGTIITKNVGAASSSTQTYYVPITLSNAQSTATPSPFQQMITFDPSTYSQYENSNLGNIRFYQGSTELHSWCESGCSSGSGKTIIWVKLPNSIPANSVTTIDMYFKPASTNYDGVYAGEAPQLSTTYAEYDDGASVFNFYDNFAGNTLSTTKWTSYSSGFSASINNGFSISLSAGQSFSGGGAYVITSNSIFSPPLIVETYASGSAAIPNTRSYMPALTTVTAATEGVSILDRTSYSNIAYSNGRDGVVTYADFQGSSSGEYYNDVSTLTGYNIIGILYTASTNTWYVNYSSVISSSTNSPTGNVYVALGMGVYDSNPYAVSMFSYWIRTRAYPPNGIMPSVSFGSVS